MNRFLGHIAWHVSQGLSLTFLERKPEIVDSLGPLGDFEPGCATWKEYWNSPTRLYEMDDSGL